MDKDANPVKDENGNPIQLDIDKGSVICFQKYREGVNYDVLQVRGFENGTKLYHFLSDITGKEEMIEFSHVEAGMQGKNELSIISTSHEALTESSMFSLYKNQLYNGYTLISDSHSHPLGSEASQPDINIKNTIIQTLERQHRHVPEFKIYKVPTGEETSY